MKIIAIENESLADGELELLDNEDSSKLFWAVTLDYVFREGATELNFTPAGGDQCLMVSFAGQSYEMVPIPDFVRPTYLRFAQEIILGQMAYACLVRFWRGSFRRKSNESILVQIGNRKSWWNALCTRNSVKFTLAA